MSQWDKLLKRVLDLDSDLRFVEVKKIIPKHKPIKKVYIEMVRDIVESEANNNENI